MNSGTIKMTEIRISNGDEIVGFGTIDKNGLIECSADLGSDVYEAIEERLGSYGQSGSVTVDGVKYTWFTN